MEGRDGLRGRKETGESGRRAKIIYYNECPYDLNIIYIKLLRRRGLSLVLTHCSNDVPWSKRC